MNLRTGRSIGSLGMLVLVLASLLGGTSTAAASAMGESLGPVPRGHKQDLISRETPARPTAHEGFGGSGLSRMRVIPDLVDGADSVVLGTVVNVADTGEGIMLVADAEVSVRIRLATVSVASVLKGPAREPGGAIAVEFYLPRGGQPWEPLRVGDHGLLFLAEDDTPFDLYHPLIPLPSCVPDPPAGLTPLEAVKRCLLLTLTLETATEALLTAPKGNTERGGRIYYEVPMCYTLESAIEGLLQLQAPDLGDALATLSRLEEPELAGLALWGMVRLQDARAFPAAIDFVLANRERAPRPASMIVHRVRMLTDPTLAPSIKPLLSDWDADWRRAALSALRNMRTREAVPLFIAALSDGDLENQNISVLALAEITGEHNEWATSWGRFQENPSYYVDEWRNWWETEGEVLYGSAAE